MSASIANGGNMTLCRICDELVDITAMIQLVPCLHMFCKSCINTHKKTNPLCPQLHCYSSLSVRDDYTWNACDNHLCTHRFGAFCHVGTLTMCKHNLCSHCRNESVRKKRRCPVYGCDGVITEEDEDQCDVCSQSRDSDRLVHMRCCQRMICTACVGQMYGDANVKPEEQKQCAPGKCSVRATKKRALEAVQMCSKVDECVHEAIRGFPSSNECEHSFCMDCLRQMIKECQFPACPVSDCGVAYHCETVAALRTLFPEHETYFAEMKTDFQHGYEGIRDDVVEVLCRAPWQPSDVASIIEVPLIKVRCMRNDDEEHQAELEVPQDIRMGEFIREVYLKLQIMDTDRIYSYYIMRDGGEIDGVVAVGPSYHNDPHKPLVKVMPVFRTPEKCAKIHFVVDRSGIVRPKI